MLVLEYYLANNFIESVDHDGSKISFGKTTVCIVLRNIGSTIPIGNVGSRIPYSQ